MGGKELRLAKTIDLFFSYLCVRTGISSLRSEGVLGNIRQMTLAIISAIIQHLKYLRDLATATPFLQPLQHSFCIQFEISVFDGCVILSIRDQFVTFVYCHIVVLLTKVVYA